jgi:hypothetical protein
MGYRLGIDGLIDFVPGIGDVAGVLVSAYIIYRAAPWGLRHPNPISRQKGEYKASTIRFERGGL